jgi:methyl-accepting chemotaxis protein
MQKNLKFSHKILLAASLLVIAAFALFTLYNDYLQRNAIREDLESYLHEMGAGTATNIEHWLSGRVLLAETLAESVALNPSAEAITALLKQKTLLSNFEFAYLGDVSGGYFLEPPDTMPEGYDARTRPWYTDAMNARKTVLTEPYVDAANGKTILTIATPSLRADGQPVGVVGGDLSLETLVETINTLDLDGSGYAFLVSADGKILVHPDSQLVMKSLKDVYPRNTPRVGDDVTEVEQDGRPNIVTFAKVEGLPSVDWYIGLSMDKAKAYSMLSEFRRSAVVATIIAVVLTITLLGMLIRLLMQPLHVMGRAMHDIAEGEGDLTRRLSIDSTDEFGALAMSFNRFVERIHDSIREVSSATSQVNEVALRVIGASNSSMLNSDQQANRTSSVAAAINELGAAAQEIAQNAALASQHSSAARSLAADGQAVVGQTIGAMNLLSQKISGSCGNIESLNASTVNIGQILEVITSISQQTNLLALNAAIEAARAGEAGRGFAVVADEVRNLAHRTQESAQQVQAMIEQLQVGARQAVILMNESQGQSESSVTIANQAGEHLVSVTQRIGEIDGMNQSVATATEEQTAVVESINVDITEINMLNQEGVENLQSTLRACADLEQQALRLKQLVGSFRI